MYMRSGATPRSSSACLYAVKSCLFVEQRTYPIKVAVMCRGVRKRWGSRYSEAVAICNIHVRCHMMLLCEVQPSGLIETKRTVTFID